MGPKLFQVKTKETNYTLRLLPIGGYVAMEGEDEESDDERAFCNKKPLQKILVIAAGATMNLLLGFLIMVGITASEPRYQHPDWLLCAGCPECPEAGAGRRNHQHQRTQNPHGQTI